MLKKNQKGFTIIEVLIVLAIAGLIMLIVLLAIPALQRNQRNTSRKNDISRLAAATTEFVSNNNGTVPSTNPHLTSILNQAGTLSELTLTAAPAAALGTPADDVLGVYTGARGALDGAGRRDRVMIVTGAQCSTTTVGATSGGSSRQISIQYLTESGGGAWTAVCQNM